MLLYRLAKKKYINDLSGEGARLFGGRWNPKVYPVLYASENRSLAILEYLVHIKNEQYLPPLSIATISVPDNIKELKTKLQKGWNVSHASDYLKKIGRKWLESMSTLLLKVPSVIVKSEYNYVINCRHRKMKEAEISHVENFEYDRRLTL